jgi:cytidylate kinase
VQNTLFRLSLAVCVYASSACNDNALPTGPVGPEGGAAGLSQLCPSPAPADRAGEQCPRPDLACEYGSDPRVECNTVATCTPGSGVWRGSVPHAARPRVSGDARGRHARRGLPRRRHHVLVSHGRVRVPSGRHAADVELRGARERMPGGAPAPRRGVLHAGARLQLRREPVRVDELPVRGEHLALATGLRQVGTTAQAGATCGPMACCDNNVSVASRTSPIVAIDGPAGAGKSTVARRLADALAYVLVDTGAMYRAVALAAQRDGVAWSDGPRLAALAHGLVEKKALAFERDPGLGVRVKLAGEDISDAIRTPEIAQGASTVSAHGEVRAVLLELQRLAGRAGGVVLEGRDIGTVVFPEAEVKFFLTASAEVRASRRHAELVAKGQTVTLEDTLADVKRRDAQDEGRAVAPLKRADTAILVDSTNLSFEETVANMLAHVMDAKRAAEK